MSLQIVHDGTAEAAAFVGVLSKRGETDLERVEPQVRQILDEVRRHGDVALVELTRRFEQRSIGLDHIEVDARRWADMANETPPEAVHVMRAAAARIRAFHERTLAANTAPWQDRDGVLLGQIASAMSRAGIYAPGGKARYPSTVLMTAVVASVAGVPEIVLCTPRPTAEVLCAAQIAGVHRVFDVGGAQAVAAMAFGTATVPRVDVLVGPGNVYVACAKRLLAGVCAIDGIAGPSEAVLLADESADAAVVAADLITQAEHDEGAYAVLVTTSATLAQRVALELDQQLASLPRRSIALASLDAHGAAIVVADLARAMALCSEIAPEHLTIIVRDPEAALAAHPVAGCIFVGPDTPQTAGDYVAGPSHVLPTGGSARFGSPLGTHHFMRRSSIVHYTKQALAAESAGMTAFARLEGLEGHARAVERRFR